MKIGRLTVAGYAVGLAVGIALVFLFMTPPRDLKRDFHKHVMLPLTLVSNFGDLISYVRLFAVGSATAAIAMAFNDLALGSGITASPLRMFDCAPLSDGAAALILCPMERAKEFTAKPVKIMGSGLATDSLALHDRESITSLASTRVASESGP